ncbi:MAG: N-acetylmuramoyl-L-alanine amidase [Ruminococcus sp.]|nr:cell wall hydrolase [Oscillospiraceae bacterium]MCI6927717.1 N-acetylmuramoyl-L-alanine amidase [Ruminococcus sp.]HBM00536.1 cell wall hydrolase [Oscillospiraceae bacterium]
MKIGKKSIIAIITAFLIILSAMLYLTFMANFSAAEASSMPITQKTVIVDAGHGGDDGGAIGIDGTVEKDINLDIALKLEKILKFYGFNVIMTRTQDVMTCDDGLDSLRKRKISDIHNRFELMRKNPDAIFISVHQNKFEDSSQHGTQVFYSGNDERSKELAEAIQTSVTLTLQRKNDRVVKKSGSGIYLLYHAKIPAVLVECGFISNSDEVKKLKDESYRMKLAILIADGLLKYLSNH